MKNKVALFFIIFSALSIQYLKCSKKQRDFLEQKRKDVSSLTSFFSTKLNKDVSGENLNGINIVGKQIYKSNFISTQLERSFIFDSFFYWVNFRGSNLTKAQLDKISFARCNFNNSSLIKLNNKNRQERVSFDDCNLKSCRLNFANLENTTFRKCNLSNSNLQKVKLNKTSFARCNFNNSSLIKLNNKNRQERVSFDDCNLKSCRLNFANLENTTFRKCNLSNSNLQKVQLGKTKFIDCNLQNIDLEDSTIEGTVLLFKNCNLSYATLSNLDLSKIVFNNCNFRKTKFKNVSKSNGIIKFNNCCFRETDLSNLDLAKSIFYRCSFYFVKMSDIDFSESKFIDCNLINININNSIFEGCNFKGSTIYKTTAIDSNFEDAINLSNRSKKSLNKSGAINVEKYHYDESDIRDLVVEISNNLTDKEIKRIIAEKKERIKDTYAKTKGYIRNKVINTAGTEMLLD